MWRKSEIWKSKKFRFLLLVEILVLILGCIGLIRGDKVVGNLNTMEVSCIAGAYDETSGGYLIDGSSGMKGDFLQVLTGKLSPGVYRLEVSLDTSENLINGFRIESTIGRYKGILSNEITLFANKDLQTCQFYVTGIGESGEISVSYGGVEPFYVKDITLVKTSAGSSILIFLTLLLAFVLNGLLMLYCYVGKNHVKREDKVVWIGIIATVFASSVPIFTDYVFAGADNIFHCMRIEALAHSILEGEIPARVESMWLCEHGYANSVFYGDTFLLIPAFLRIVGFHMTFAYNAYVFAVNLATVLLSYVCFKRIFSSKYVGVFGALLYTMAPYRLYNIYNRSAVGEYTAMTFLPLLVLGFYLLFAEDTEKKEYKSYWLIPVLGFSGIIQSHTLSCEITGVFTILLCLVLWKRVFRKRTFVELVKVVVGTVLVNAWFLVPFLDMTLSGTYYFSGNTNVTVQHRGILLANIFDTMQKAGQNSRFHELGLWETEPLNVGIAIMLGVAAWFFSGKLCDEKAEGVNKGAVKVALGFGLITLVMSTAYFPWNAIQSWNSITGTLVPMLQFTTRLLILPTVCFVFVACAAAKRFLRATDTLTKYGFFGLVCGASLLFGMYQLNDGLVSRDGYMRLYSSENIGNSAVLGAEYLPDKAEMNFTFHDAVPSTGVTVENYEKSGLHTKTQITVKDKAGSYWVELPMLLYKGYEAKDAATGERFEMVSGTHGDVRVMLPAGYSGTVNVDYTGMWYWHAAEAISLIGLMGMAASVLWRAHKKRKIVLKKD